MPISLTVGQTTVDLHEDLLWSDEHDWWPVEQTSQRTITGALVVSSATRIGGRPITLAPPDDNSAWHTRTVVELLRTWASTPGQIMTLAMRGTTYTVIFRHHDNGGLDAKPVADYRDPEPTDWYRLTLRLMEVQQ